MTAAEIAKLANVTRAAVSNWRKRYPDFPAPASGVGRTARFALADVEAWLNSQGKTDDGPSPEVLLWQALRARYGDDLVEAVADVADELTTGNSSGLGPDSRAKVHEMARDSSPNEVVDALLARVLASPSRAGAEPMSTPRLTAAVLRFAGPARGKVFDPACGVGSLLLACRGSDEVTLFGQELDPNAARLAACRATLGGGPQVTIRVGDSLRDDQWPDLRADLVVCETPVNASDWGRDELLLDRRWEFGVPTRAESELAWLQHCYAHVAPGGRAVVVMPASAAYRKAGRRIRAELVRRGVLTQVVALPGGMVPSHQQPVQLWSLTRPTDGELVGSHVRMIDLSDHAPGDTLEPDTAHTVDVPAIDLLDEEVDLTPGRYVAAARIDHLADYEAARAAVASRLAELETLLPTITAGPGSLDSAAIKIADLARAGLVEVSGDAVTSTSDRLDTDYLAGFARSAANIKQATSSSGTFRVDVRGARIPQMSIADQRAYGAAFRRLDEFERSVTELARWSRRAVELARDGLARGALRPGPDTAD
ncbi:N-6 DNA methylase [Lentzea atacamensis]|uniref:N-6 DNA methylase n=1 Tax=Lentzea atacamensis TaxID=531938 RepID=A0ABX9DYS2_9PSEU|nr:N-6 DNA methylase [Lentzea atacamensis]